MNTQEIRRLLHAKDKEQEELFGRSDAVRREAIGDKVHFRGIIEFSNMCEKNCYYCGIRSGNKKVERYKMNMDEMRECLNFVHNAKYGSVVLQSGELTTPGAKEYILEVVRLVNHEYPELGITLSLGELDYEFLKVLKDAGAHRYLLRIETSVPELYKKLHPESHSLEKRIQVLKDLRKIGYQVGCGNMVGTPGQTDDDLIADLEFFQKMDFDMFGLGPYVIHEDTPLGTEENKTWWKENKREILNTTLNYIALLRILIPTANIATATALEAIHPHGRIKALKAGANIFMPSVTPGDYRKQYLLYQNKPCVDEDAGDCKGCSVAKVRASGLVPGLGEQGNSKHFALRKNT